MSDPTTLAYLAGVIDSDGCIGIHKNTHNIRFRTAGTHHAVYVPRLSIGQVDTDAVYLARATFGGLVHARKPKGNRRVIHTWKMDGGKALPPVLEALIPYLRIKRDRAENVLQFIALTNQLRWPKVAVSPGEPLITASEFSRLVGINRSTVGCATLKGTIPSVKHGRSNMVPESFVAEYLRRKAIGLTRRRCPVLDSQMEDCYLRARELNGVGLTPHIPAVRYVATIPPARSTPAGSAH